MIFTFGLCKYFVNELGRRLSIILYHGKRGDQTPSIRRFSERDVYIFDEIFA